MSKTFSPKEVALAIGVSESSLKRWVDKGLISAVKTSGGHRRLQVDAVIGFLRREGRSLASPELLGLPEREHGTPCETGSAHSRFITSLLNGDSASAHRAVLDEFLGGKMLAEIFDRMLTPAFHEIGNLWHCGNVEVYQERRACEICVQLIQELRRLVGVGPENGPLAIGGTLDGDPYTLAAGMTELVLRENGWRAMSLGNMLPFGTLVKAIENDRPRLLWLSVTTIRDPERFAAQFNVLFDTAAAHGCLVVAGGQALTADIRRMLRYTTFCDNFRHLEAFSKSSLTHSASV